MEPEDIIRYREHLKGVWSQTHTHWDKVIDPWIWGSPNIWGPGSQRSTYIPSTARNIIEHASDTQLVWEPKLHRRPVGRGRQHEKDADDVEAGLFAVFLDAMLREPSMAFKDAGKFMSAYGYAVIEGPMIDFEDRPVEPKKTRGMSQEEFEWARIDYQNSLRSWNPIRIRAPHPGHILLDPCDRQPKQGIRYDRRYIKDIRKMVEHLYERKRKPEFVVSKQELERMLPDGLNPWQTEEVTELWSDKDHQVMYRNQLLFSEKNRWGFIPYNHAFTGFGMKKTEDQANDPFWLAQGLLDPIMSGLKTQAQAMSAKQNALIERSYLRVMTAGDASELATQLGQEDAIIEGNEQEIGFLRYPELERALFQIGSEVDSDIEMGTFSRSIAGQRQQGVSTVGQQAILSTAATRKFASTNKQLNMMATVVAQNILRLIDRYGESIEVGGVALSPQMLHHDYTVVAEFQTLDPILQLQEREMGLRELSAGVKSRESYRENDLKVANESLEFKRIMKEQIRQMPEYTQAMAREIAREDGMLEMMAGLQEGQPATAGEPDIETPQISDQAGGGATRALRTALTPDTMNPPRTPLPPSPLGG